MIAVTVDAQGTRRAVTKLVGNNRLVSCTCCTPTVCCMYPANQLGVGYTEDDLPDTINFSGQIMGVPTYVVATRSGSEYVTATQSNALGQTFTQTIFVDFEYGEWIISGNATGDPCLFIDDISEEFAIEDFFADTYEVSGPVSGTVTRQTRCVWSGTGLTLSNYGYQWTVNGNAKSGNQNTPVGSYANGYSVSE